MHISLRSRRLHVLIHYKSLLIHYNLLLTFYLKKKEYKIGRRFLRAFTILAPSKSSSAQSSLSEGEKDLSLVSLESSSSLKNGCEPLSPESPCVPSLGLGDVSLRPSGLRRCGRGMHEGGEGSVPQLPCFSGTDGHGRTDRKLR